MIDINQIIAAWVEDRENMDREIIVLKMQGDSSSLYLAALVKSRSALDYKITRSDSSRSVISH
jgi:hypothetical protein